MLEERTSFTSIPSSSMAHWSSSLVYCGERGNSGASETLEASSRLVKEFDLLAKSSWLTDELIGFLC